MLRYDTVTPLLKEVLSTLLDFEEADSMADPKCLEGKDWDNIKLDFIDVVSLNI